MGLLIPNWLKQETGTGSQFNPLLRRTNQTKPRLGQTSQSLKGVKVWDTNPCIIQLVCAALSTISWPSWRACSHSVGFCQCSDFKDVAYCCTAPRFIVIWGTAGGGLGPDPPLKTQSATHPPHTHLLYTVQTSPLPAWPADMITCETDHQITQMRKGGRGVVWCPCKDMFVAWWL